MAKRRTSDIYSLDLESLVWEKLEPEGHVRLSLSITLHLFLLHTKHVSEVAASEQVFKHITQCSLAAGR